MLTGEEGSNWQEATPHSTPLSASRRALPRAPRRSRGSVKEYLFSGWLLLVVFKKTGAPSWI